LRDAYCLDYWRPTLAVGEAIRFVLVGVHPSEFFTIGVMNRNHVVMVLASLISIERSLAALFGILGI